MTHAFRPTRRAALAGLLGSAVVFAGRSAHAASGRKLVVVIQRGGLDGLSLAPPPDRDAYRALRGAIAVAEPRPFVEGFGLHPALARVSELAAAGRVRLAPAAALPQRLRSHFEAQDLLESGRAAQPAGGTGWLSRALQAGGGRALAVGASTPLVLRGGGEVATWTPGPGLDARRGLAGTLQDLYVGDPLLGPALASALALDETAMEALDGEPAPKASDPDGLGRALARFLAAADGPDILALSLDGYDTHARQGADEGQLAQRLRVFDRLIAGLEAGLGPLWDRTLVLTLTEFGRTARVNGTLGTDHGTAFASLLLGGAVKSGGIVGDWPGLSETALFENRDLRPALDVRALCKGVLAEHLGFDRRDLDARVFPDSVEARAVTGLA